MTFEHYIITRFNLPVFRPKLNGTEMSSACDEQYLEYRFKLFERYCMPSIKNQTCQNFKWLVLMDARTPDRFKRRLQELHEAYDNLRPFYLNLDDYKSPFPKEYIELYDNYASVVRIPDYAHIEEDKKREIQHIVTPIFIRDCIKSISSSVPDYYITTRIDNDDSFHKDIVSEVQRRVKESPRRVVLDFPNTYKYIAYEKVMYMYTLRNNHFLSIVESSNDTFQSAIYWNHLYIDKFVSTEHVYTRPMQIEVIHGNNVVNDFRELSVKGLMKGLWNFSEKDYGLVDVVLSKRHMMVMILSLIKKQILRKN